MHATAIVRRSCGSSDISAAKPPPSAPNRLLAGTRTESKNNSEVSADLCPSLSRLRPRLKPSRSASTRIRLIPREPGESLVRATTITRSACWPLEIKVFEPLTTYSSPCSTARVLMPCRSLPVPGSVMAMAHTVSPDTILGSHFCFCASLP
ncbi:hypothetical protein D3C84_820900 [compost metagenome]